MLDMGFRPAVDRLVAQCPADRQTLFFSATLDGEVGRIASVYTTDAIRHEHAPAPETRADIEHRFRAVDRESRIDALVDELDDAELALVFVRTKRGADRLVKRLDREGVRAVAMHGNKSQNQRERALAAFGAGRVEHARRHRRRRARHRRHRHLARDQLRRPRRPRELRAPDRPHRPRGRHGHRDHVRRGRAGPRRRPDRRRAAPARRVRARGPRARAARRTRAAATTAAVAAASSRAPRARARRRLAEARRSGCLPAFWET